MIVNGLPHDSQQRTCPSTPQPGWTLRRLSYVAQEGAEPVEMSMNPSSVALPRGWSLRERVAASLNHNFRKDCHGRVSDEHLRRLRSNCLAERMRAITLGGPEEHMTGAGRSRHSLQDCGGIADVWYLDGGGILRRRLISRHLISPTQRLEQKGVGSRRQSSTTSRRLKSLNQNGTSTAFESRRKQARPLTEPW